MDDPDDHCTDSGWVSIPHGKRLDYRFLCPEQLSYFCVTSTRVWKSKKPGVADKLVMERGCSGKMRYSHKGDDDLGEAAGKFAVKVGCTSYSYEKSSGAMAQLCFCKGHLCNGAGLLTAGWVLMAMLLLSVLAESRWC